MAIKEQKDNVVKKEIMYIIKDLDLEVKKGAISAVSYAMLIRTMLHNWRQGTVLVKGRSQVSCTNKKPWKQKGTGFFPMVAP